MKHKYGIGQVSICAAAIFLSTLVACGGGGSSSAGGATNPYLAELSGNTGLRAFDSGNTYTSTPPKSWVDRATANSDGTYTISATTQSLIGGAWVEYTSPVNTYYLNAAGNWEANSSTTSIAVTPNSNGSLSWIDPFLGKVTATPVAVDLSGASLITGKDMPLAISTGTVNVKVGAISPMDASGYYTNASGVIPANAMYPAGSTEWVLNGITTSQDVYLLYGLATYIVKTPSGELTAISITSAKTFTSTNPLCFSNMRMVYVSEAAETAKFNVYSSVPSPTPTCAAITTETITATVDLTFTTVRGQAIVQTSNYSVPGTNSPFIWEYPAGNETAILGSVNGKVHWGLKIPANFALDDTNISEKYGLQNKTAMDAVMIAAGLPTF